MHVSIVSRRGFFFEHKSPRCSNTLFLQQPSTLHMLSLSTVNCFASSLESNTSSTDDNERVIYRRNSSLLLFGKRINLKIHLIQRNVQTNRMLMSARDFSRFFFHCPIPALPFFFYLLVFLFETRILFLTATHWELFKFNGQVNTSKFTQRQIEPTIEK